MQRQGKTFLTLHTALFTPCTSHFTLALRTRHFISSQIMWALLTSSQLFSSHPISFHMSSKQVLLNCFPSHLSTDQLFSSPRSSSQLIIAVLYARKLLLSERSRLHKKTIGCSKFLKTDTWDTNAFRQKRLSEILCTTKLAQRTFQYYFVLQSLHKARSSTTLCYKACTKHCPVLLLLVLQRLHKALPSTTLYYKACTKHFPVLLCTTKLARSTSQYYFVLQSLQKALPSTTLYYKACTKHFPVLLCTTKLA